MISFQILSQAPTKRAECPVCFGRRCDSKASTGAGRTFRKAPQAEAYRAFGPFFGYSVFQEVPIKCALFSTIRGSGWSGLNIRMIHCELSHGHPLPRTVLNVSDVDLRGFDRQQNDLRWDTKPHWHNAGSNSSRYE